VIGIHKELHKLVNINVLYLESNKSLGLKKHKIHFSQVSRIFSAWHTDNNNIIE
jgi:hypothetical protein